MKNWHWNILLAVSGASVGLLILNAYRLNVDKLIIQIPMFLCIGTAMYLIARIIDIRSKVVLINKGWQWTIIGYLSIYSAYILLYQYSKYFSSNYPDEINTIFFVKIGLLAVLGLFAIVTVWRFLFWIIASLYRKLAFTKLEKILLTVYVSIGVVVAVALSVFVTNNFVLKLNIVDTVYAMDSSAMIFDEIHDNNLYGINTDIRHPFAQATNTPMGVISRVLGQLLHFVPYAQAHAFQMFIIMMIGVVGILVTRLLRVKGVLQVFVFLAYSCLYSTLIFTFAVEMYVQSVFFLVLFVYGIIHRWSFRWNLFFLVVSTGFIITSAIAGILLLLEKGDSIKNRIMKAVAALAAFVATIIISGKVITLFAANKVLGGSSEFSGDMSLADKIHQFTNFIASTLTVGYHEVFFDGSFHKYRTAELAIQQVNPVGLIILILVLVGVWVGRKQLLTWIAAGWSAFAFIICVIIGWGSAMNEMALYSFYFGWSYFILAFIGVNWLVGLVVKNIRQRKAVLITLCLMLSAINIVAFSDIIRFTHSYYPTSSLKETIQEVLPYEQEAE